MATAALVLTLEDDSARREGALAALASMAGVTLGRPIGTALPMVLETDGAEHGESVLEAIGATPGVAFVDVVSIDFSDSHGPP